MQAEELVGWGNYPRARCDVARPAFADLVGRYVAGDRPRGVTPRGLGRSYGDAAHNDHGDVIDVTALDRLLAFDPEHATLTCEAGVTLKDIIDVFAPRGFFPAITPGTKYVTVGGCIASDVHGKAHHKDGCFSSCVDSFTILLASGEVVRASRPERSDLFWACFGGMGLLGVILTATIRLRRITTTFFRQTVRRAAGLDAMLDAIDETNDTYPYAVAWVDPLATGARLGRGVLTVGDHADVDELPPALRHAPLAVSGPPRITVPTYLPSATINPLTMRALNVVLDQVQARGAAYAHYEQFFYPLDAIGHWNRGYGRRGFTQYQFVVPLADGRRSVRALLEAIATSGEKPCLNVLKRFGPEAGIISFPFEGYTYAVDFPVTDGLPRLLRALDELVLAHGGRVYLTKDAFLDAPTFAAMYPRLSEWRRVKATYDPGGVFQSSLSRRVGLT